jgi:uncharacterized phage protein (TIGR02218 family)
MRQATPELKAFLAANRQFVCADLIKFTLLSGQSSYVTTSDVALNWDGNTYRNDYVMVTGLRYRLTAGLEADEQSMTITADRMMTISGVPILDALRNGILDGARVQRLRAYLPDWGSVTAVNSGIVGVLDLFSGYVSKIDSIGRTTADVRLKSDIALLDIEMPRRKYQAACLNTVYDQGCGLSKGDWTTAGTVAFGSTKTSILSMTGSEQFIQGTLLFTSGGNAGQTRTIKSASALGYTLAYPVLVTPEPGDTFLATKGCDKTMATCTTRFSNQANYVGFPYIPVTEKAY